MYPVKLPKKKYWYHATTVDNAAKILADGGLKNRAFGIYFANRRDYAGAFGRQGDWQARQNGESSHIVVFKIPTKRIKDLELGIDHNPRFYPKDLVTAVTNEMFVPVFRDDICAQWKYE